MRGDPVGVPLEPFEVDQTDRGWNVRCRGCGRGWELVDNGGDPHPGNLLHLLNHAAGCSKLKALLAKRS